MKKFAFLPAALIGALILTGAISVLAQKKPATADPWAGTWKMDLANSKLHGPAPKEETITSSGSAGGVVKYSIGGTAADGTPINESYDGKSDGKPYPFLANGQKVADISYHRDSDHQYSSHGTAADGSTTAATVTLSKDGKTLTVQEHVKTSQGEFDQTIVYNKQ
jgi:anti-sigma factor RsiW